MNGRQSCRTTKLISTMYVFDRKKCRRSFCSHVSPGKLFPVCLPNNKRRSDHISEPHAKFRENRQRIVDVIVREPIHRLTDRQNRKKWLDSKPSENTSVRVVFDRSCFVAVFASETSKKHRVKSATERMPVSATVRHMKQMASSVSVSTVRTLLWSRPSYW